jgi:hypothetical protein
MQDFAAGTPAFVDGFGGLIPIRVISVDTPGSGAYVTSGRLTARVEKSMAGYRKGEIITGTASQFPPRKMVRRRGFHQVIGVNYRWV